MLSTRTGIGLAVGIAVTGIGLFALITSLGLQSTEVNDTYGVGEYTKYRFTAPAHAKQYLEINGTSFHVTLVSPGDGLQIPGVTHKNDISIEWVHLIDGESIIEIQNAFTPYYCNNSQEDPPYEFRPPQVHICCGSRY